MTSIKLPIKAIISTALALFITACTMTPALAEFEPLDNTKQEVVRLEIGTTVTFLECGIQRETPPAGARLYEMLPNGLEAVHFDTDFNGLADAMLLIPQGDENRYPLLYSFSLKYPEQSVDIVYRDTKRDGSCDGIVQHWIRPSNPKGGT